MCKSCRVGRYRTEEMAALFNGSWSGLWIEIPALRNLGITLKRGSSTDPLLLFDYCRRLAIFFGTIAETVTNIANKATTAIV